MPNYNRKTMLGVIDDYVINPRYREVLRLRYCEGFPYEAIGEMTHYSTQHVKHICKTYKEYLIGLL